MTKNKTNHNKALDFLRQDKVMAVLIKKYPIPVLHRPRHLFVALTHHIIGQQLSNKAADTIIFRFEKLFSGIKFPSPSQILKTPDEKIRSAGLSRAKVSYLKSLSRAVTSESLKLDILKTLPDEVVITELTKVKGIGRWTAEMVLIFHLQRPDVFSLGDLGLRNAVSKLYGIDRDDLKKIQKISQKWKPFRSLASRYLWQSLDND